MIEPIRISSPSLEAARQIRRQLPRFRSRLVDVDGEWLVEVDTEDAFDPAIIAAVDAMAAARKAHVGDFTLHVAGRDYPLGR